MIERPIINLQFTAGQGERYSIERLIGKGGVAEVYLAYDKSRNKCVALKVLHETFLADKSQQVRFKREFAALQKCNHENVAKVYDFGVMKNGQLFFCMEYYPWATVRQRLEQVGKLTPQRTHEVMKQLLLGLEHMHALGMVHRDLKPSNILISGETEVVIADFGLVRNLQITQMTKSGTLLGTLKYLSPEQRLGKKCDCRSDLYQAGLITLELLLGKLPKAPLDYLKDSVLPSNWLKFVTGLLHDEPDARIKSASAALDALNKVELKDSVLEIELPNESLTPEDKPPLGNRYRAVMWVIFLVTIFFMLILVIKRGDSELTNEPLRAAEGYPRDVAFEHRLFGTRLWWQGSAPLKATVDVLNEHLAKDQYVAINCSNGKSFVDLKRIDLNTKSLFINIHSNSEPVKTYNLNQLVRQKYTSLKSNYGQPPFNRLMKVVVGSYLSNEATAYLDRLSGPAKATIKYEKALADFFLRLNKSKSISYHEGLEEVAPLALFTRALEPSFADSIASDVQEFDLLYRTAVEHELFPTFLQPKPRGRYGCFFRRKIPVGEVIELLAAKAKEIKLGFHLSFSTKISRSSWQKSFVLQKPVDKLALLVLRSSYCWRAALEITLNDKMPLFIRDPRTDGVTFVIQRIPSHFFRKGKNTLTINYKRNHSYNRYTVGISSVHIVMPDKVDIYQLH